MAGAHEVDERLRSAASASGRAFRREFDFDTGFAQPSKPARNQRIGIFHGGHHSVTPAAIKASAQGRVRP